jgi:histidyl-tRNA synthetase
LKRSLELANKLGARFAVIVGDNEMTAGNYVVKNMATGEQYTANRQELTERIRS